MLKRLVHGIRHVFKRIKQRPIEVKQNGFEHVSTVRRLCAFAEVGEIFDLLRRQLVDLDTHRFEFQSADDVFDFDGNIINCRGH